MYRAGVEDFECASCPEVTLCGCWNVEIPEVTNFIGDYCLTVPTRSPSRGGDVAIYVKK